MNPLVSIISPVRNGAEWIAESIGSVHSQTYQPIEMIVVDDGSTDRSAQVARDLGVTVRQQPPRGQPAALNTGLKASQGEFVGFLDADDLYPPRRVESMIDMLRDREDADGVFGLMEEFADDEAGTLRKLRPAAPSRHPNCMLLRRTFVQRIGPFDETFELASVPAWLAVAQASGARLVGIDEVVLLRRLHSSNMGLTRWSERAEYARAMHAGLVAGRKLKGDSQP